MAVFNITVQAKINLAPSQIGDNSIDIADPLVDYTFSSNDFTSGTNPKYVDPEGDAALKIKITTLESSGDLELNSIPVVLNQEITIIDIDAGLLKYLPIAAGGYTATFQFDVADVGSTDYSGLTPGIISLIVSSAINLPPSNVDDGSTIIGYGLTVVFTEAMFTVNYADPESDGAFQLKILTLPVLGALSLNGEEVVVNQVILFTDIALNLFTYIPDLADTDGDLQSFTFAIADSGSGEFTS